VGYFAGLDVSLEETAICIVDDAGRIVRAARAGVFGQAGLVNWQHFRVLARQPNWRGSRGRGQHHLNAGAPELVHNPLQPPKIEAVLLGFAQTPEEFPETHHVDTGLLHQFDVPFPSRLRVFSTATIRVNPLLRMIIDAEIHCAVLSRAVVFRRIKTSKFFGNLKLNKLELATGVDTP